MAQSREDYLAQFTDEQLAYHEAGHAIIHHLQGGLVTRLSIERTDARQGTHIGPQSAPAQSAGSAVSVRLLASSRSGSTSRVRSCPPRSSSMRP